MDLATQILVREDLFQIAFSAACHQEDTIAGAVYRIRDDVMAGTPLALSIRTTGLFPSMLLQMVSIGEESGSLDDMLAKVADHYEAAVDNAVDSLSSLIEPIIMSVLGVLIGGLMIAMYLPIFMLGSVI